MVYTIANHGMYGLPHSGLIANELLRKRLNKRSYQQNKLVPGLWKHEWLTIQFTLVVDDFGLKYVEEEHALHLKQTLEENYKVTTYWDGTICIGITQYWDHERIQVHLLLPGYTNKVLKHFKHTKRKRKPTIPKRAHHIWGQKTICDTTIRSAATWKKGKKFIQQVCGKFLFLRRAVNSTPICPISAIA